MLNRCLNFQNARACRTILFPGFSFVTRQNTQNVFFALHAVFTRDRTVFLVGLSKHGSRMRDRGKAWALANQSPGASNLKERRDIRPLASLTKI
jgi:hypothetical protein